MDEVVVEQVQHAIPGNAVGKLLRREVPKLEVGCSLFVKNRKVTTVRGQLRFARGFGLEVVCREAELDGVKGVRVWRVG